MAKYIMNSRLFFAVIMILVAATYRFLPHWPNFTPIAAIALFGGTYLGKKHLAMVIPLAALFISDLIIGFHGYMWAVYLGIAAVVLLGFHLRSRVSTANIIVMSLISSGLFFLLTNFAVWIGSPFYPQTFSGLLLSYTAGMPFFLNSILGDLFFNAVLFGGYAMAFSRLQSLKVYK